METSYKTMKKAPAMKVLKSAVPDPYNSLNKKEQEKNKTIDPRPTFSISEEGLPEITSWTIDGKYKLNLEVEMRGIREEDWGINKGKKVADLKITKIGVESENDSE